MERSINCLSNTATTTFASWPLARCNDREQNAKSRRMPIVRLPPAQRHFNCPLIHFADCPVRLMNQNCKR